MTEQQIKASVRLMCQLDRELYFEHLEIAKEGLGLPLTERSLEAANLALARTIRNRRIRRANGWTGEHAEIFPFERPRKRPEEAPR